MYKQEYASPLGLITIASDGESVTGLWFEGQKHFAATLPPDAETATLPIFAETTRWLDEYFAGKKPSVMPPIRMAGSEFQQRVWQELLKIPYGAVVTYGDIAKKIAAGSGKKPCAQAVGGAVGHNPISIVVPCHRVIGCDGSLTGYAAGEDRKLWLLRHEGATDEGQEEIFAESSCDAK